MVVTKEAVEGEIVAPAELMVILEEQQVSKETVNELVAAFGAPFIEAGEILANFDRDEETGDLVIGEGAVKVTSVDQKEEMLRAKEQRLALKRSRTTVENKRKELKEESLKTGRAIDAVARFVKTTIEPVEQYLESQEKFAEIRAAEQAALLKAKRIEELSQYTDNISLYNFEALSDEQFDSLIATLKAQKEAEVSAAKKAEDDRLAAEEAERKRQAEVEAENARLKAEAEKREKELADDRAKAEAEAKKREEKDAAERAKLQADADKRLADERAKAEAERKKREEIEAEQRRREDAEAKERADAEEAQRQSLLAPDKEKLLKLATELEEMKLPALQSKNAQAALVQVEGLLEKVTKYIRGNVKGL